MAAGKDIGPRRPARDRAEPREDLAELSRRLRVLEDEAEIRRLVSRRQWHADAGHGGPGVPSWQENGAVETLGSDIEEAPGLRSRDPGRWTGVGLSGHFEGHTRSHGRDRSAFARDRRRWMPQMMHFLTNEFIEVESADVAAGRWYSWEPATVLVDGRLMSVWIAGRYEMSFVKEDGAWRIAEMCFQEIFSTPYSSRGWVECPHVSYGPGQIGPQSQQNQSQSSRSTP
ncbi:nuclear transport factor 2 family protein [Microtetraspora glauca]|uniref:Nuclear transport factor 2 family protein n=1 Tax=Microtetraspora glauca TaxID=1996 RepID=A0ABV3GTG1_MICGL